MASERNRRASLPLERIAREVLLPRLSGFGAVSPSPFERHRQPSVLLYMKPIEDVLIGIQLKAWSESEFHAHYVAMPLLAPTDDPGFHAVGMYRHPVRSLFGDRRWVLDGRRDDRVAEELVTYVVEEGLPLLRCWAALETYAESLTEDEHELESYPLHTEEAAYAFFKAGRDDRAIELLGVLIDMKGRDWPGEAELSQDEMEVVRERVRRMLGLLRTDRPAALDQLDRWRRARLQSLGLQ